VRQEANWIETILTDRKAERREQKRRKRMRVSGKGVFKILEAKQKEDKNV